MSSSRATKKQRISTLESSSESDEEEEKEGTLPVIWGGVGRKKRVLTKQLSMRETKRELKWEKRKRQMRLRSLGGKRDGVSEVKGGRSLTDEDLDELRGSIELGFGFDEENGGHDLCRTLPALNLYFAVNRQFSDPRMSPMSTPKSSTVYGTPSPRSPFGQTNLEEGNSADGSLPAESWKIFNPGDSPQHVKARLRHWAQAVACSVRHCC